MVRFKIYVHVLIAM